MLQNRLYKYYKSIKTLTCQRNAQSQYLESVLLDKTVWRSSKNKVLCFALILMSLSRCWLIVFKPVKGKGLELIQKVGPGEPCWKYR